MSGQRSLPGANQNKMCAHDLSFAPITFVTEFMPVDHCWMYAFYVGGTASTIIVSNVTVCPVLPELLTSLSRLSVQGYHYWQVYIVEPGLLRRFITQCVLHHLNF